MRFCIKHLKKNEMQSLLLSRKYIAHIRDFAYLDFSREGN